MVEQSIADAESLVECLVDQIAAKYCQVWGVERDLVTVQPGDGYSYLYDATNDASQSGPAPRVLAGWGRSHAPGGARDKQRLRGFPLPPSAIGTDRGHLIARSAGSRDDLGINLIPQDSRINRGQGPLGRRWRRLERLASSRPGTPVLVRAVYDDDSDVRRCWSTSRSSMVARPSIGFPIAGTACCERFDSVGSLTQATDVR